jgi:site-specific recombinase XerD
MRNAQHARYGHRLNGLIVVLWRAGLRINEALSLTETDLDERRGSILVRHGKNDRRREVGMDPLGVVGVAAMAGRAREAALRAPILPDRRTHPRPRLVGERRAA